MTEERNNAFIKRIQLSDDSMSIRLILNEYKSIILEEIEKSLMSDDEIKSDVSYEVHNTNGNIEARYNFGVVDSAIFQRNKIQRLINKLKK